MTSDFCYPKAAKDCVFMTFYNCKHCLVMKSVYYIFISGAFVVSWMPYSVVSLITVFGDPSTVPLTVTMVPALLAKSSIIWNPIIYVARHNDFRRACLKILPECCILNKIRQYASRSNKSSTSRNLTEQFLLEALINVRNSRKPRHRIQRVLEHQNTSSISLFDSTTISGNLTDKKVMLPKKSWKDRTIFKSKARSCALETRTSSYAEGLTNWNRKM